MNNDSFPLFDEEGIKRHNESAWDKRARQKMRFTNTASKEDYLQANELIEKNSWLQGGIRGKKLLNLAAGGGGQSGLFASLGADVTVVDISAAMLENDQKLAKEQGFNIRVLQTSMDDLNALDTAEFDIVIHPVSTCYLPDIKVIYQEVARVSKAGAIYISHHKQPLSMQASAKPINGFYQIVETNERKGALPPVKGTMHREEGTLEFLHSWDDILGELCRNGFYIDDFYVAKHGDPNAELGSFEHRSSFISPFLSIKAIRRNDDKTTKIIIS